MTLKVTFWEHLTSVEGFSALRNVPAMVEQQPEGVQDCTALGDRTGQATDRAFLVRRVYQLPALSKFGDIICGFSNYTPCQDIVSPWPTNQLE